MADEGVKACVTRIAAEFADATKVAIDFKHSKPIDEALDELRFACTADRPEPSLHGDAELVERVAKAIYFANDRFTGDEEVAAQAALRACGYEQLLGALRGLRGLLQLLAANPETPPALLNILTENHRVIEADRVLAALSAHGDVKARP